MNVDETKRKEAQQLDQLFYALVADVQASVALWGDRNDGFSKRVYIKTAISLVEGVTQLLKNGAIFYDSLNITPVLSSEEIVMLKEEQVYVKDNGEVATRRSPISLLPNFRLAILCNAKVRNIDYKLDTSCDGWHQLKKAIQIRDRITHPHSMTDLDISTEDMHTIDAAMSYFRNATIPLLGR